MASHCTMQRRTCASTVARVPSPPSSQQLLVLTGQMRVDISQSHGPLRWQ
ncbi:hypothetical protein [Streptomyces sp. H27-S2]|nr:hypothetical protein [Streptomyces sp. H27-S2]MCY0951337.1 hypothetical protein [Streptomyces sp. H27-S2]